MTRDIFDFWAEVAPGDRTHPKDRDVLARIDHGFNLECLPSGFSGPLRSAPVVLLYLSPGFKPQDVVEANTLEGKTRYVGMRTGLQALPGPEDFYPAWKWWESRTKIFGPWTHLRDKIALLNLGGYHSENVKNPNMLLSLPSYQVAKNWAKDILFPQAEQGDRVVVCMRSVRLWGFDSKPRRYGKALFVPKFTRSGHMHKTGEHADMRNEVIAAVKAAIGYP